MATLIRVSPDRTINAGTIAEVFIGATGADDDSWLILISTATRARHTLAFPNERAARKALPLIEGAIGKVVDPCAKPTRGRPPKAAASAPKGSEAANALDQD